MPELGSFSQFKEDHIKGEITDFNNPDCVDCYECCSMGTMITNEEYTALKSFLKHSGKPIYDRGISLIKKHWEKGTIYWMCPFSKNKRCLIYNTRPLICRQFHCKEELRDVNYMVNKDQLEKEGHHMIFDLFKKGLSGLNGTSNS